MASSTDYEYINDNSIHEDLICPICYDPFERPLCANQCGHTFCRKCITNAIRKTSKCPLCSQVLTLNDFHAVTTRPFLNQLNKIHVKCHWCSQVNIQRGNFKDHAKTCTKFIVSCPAADIKCDWTGQRENVQDHLKVCVLMKVQPMMAELNSQVKQQSEQIRFLYTILEKTAKHHTETCPDKFTTDTIAYCDICEQAITFDEHTRCLHFCPDTDVCFNCVKKHFL